MRLEGGVAAASFAIRGAVHNSLRPVEMKATKPQSSFSASSYHHLLESAHSGRAHRAGRTRGGSAHGPWDAIEPHCDAMAPLATGARAPLYRGAGRHAGLRAHAPALTAPRARPDAGGGRGRGNGELGAGRIAPRWRWRTCGAVARASAAAGAELVSLAACQLQPGYIWEILVSQVW